MPNPTGRFGTIGFWFIMRGRRRHEYTQVLASDAQMFVRWDVEQDIVSFAVVLQAMADGRWESVQLFDCSHPGQNDRHRYSRKGIKGAPENFHNGTPGQAFRDAIDLIRNEYERMISEWR